MSDSGPTTVGSIDAKLTLDASAFEAKADEAKATAHELGALSPDIKVDANVAGAIEKLSGVAMAEQRLEAAQRSAANTASTAYLASMRLEEAQKKGGVSALQLAAAEEALARADRNAEAAELKLLAATEAVKAAQHGATTAAEEDTAATDANTQANHRRVSGIQVLIGLAPAILAAAAPIGAAAIGLGAAFGVMAVSGVAAIAGIKDAMAAGTAEGNTYAAGLSILKTDLDKLEGTAATAMLSSFNTVVGDINASMPFLNQKAGEFSGILGQIGGNALQGVLTGLERMNPLLLVGGAELSKFVSWLSGITASNGFTQFVNYAVDNLPAVMHLIESLVTTAGNILAAFAPLGPVVVTILSAITDGLNALPLPILAGLVTTATLLAPALRIAGTAMALFGVEANLAVPVVGVLLAAVAGIGIAFAASASSNAVATGAVSDYTTQLERTNGVIDESIRKAAAKQLVDSGAAQAANDLGIGTSQLTDYVLGNAGAQERLTARIKAVKDAYNNTGIVVDNFGNSSHVVTQEQQAQYDAAIKLENGLKSQKGAFDQAKTDQELYKGTLDGTTGAISAQDFANQQLAARYGMTLPAYMAAKDASDKQATSAAAAAQSMFLENDAAGLLKMALDKLNGKAISAAQAQNTFDSAIANSDKHVNAAGKTINRASASLNGMSAAAVKNRGELIGQVTSLEGVAEAMRNNGATTDATRKKMIAMRDQIIKNAVAHGEDKDAVTRYIDTLLHIPAKIPPTKLDVDKANAEAKIAAFKALLASIHDKNVQITTDYVDVHGKDTGIPNTTNVGGANRGIPLHYSTGGQVAYLASGGFPGGPRGSDTVPTWLTPNEYVMPVSAVKSVGVPALDHIRATGQLPPTGGGQPHITVYVTNPFTGAQVQAVVATTVRGAINAADRDSLRRRVG